MRLKAWKQVQRDLGQYLTPAPIADFMASLFSQQRRKWTVLDAGAGAGSLSAALLSCISMSPQPVTCVAVTAYELDASMIPLLRRTYAKIEDRLEQRAIKFTANIYHADFIEAASETIRDTLFEKARPRFNAAILNPPYRKINSNSRTRTLLRSVGIETSNLYAAFLALTTSLLEPDGELVAITPRSFCNGPYFKPFRKLLLERMSLRQIHVFESRAAAFYDDGVLQENIIVHAVKSPVKPASIVISTSSGEPHSPVVSRTCDYGEVVVPNDPSCFIHLVTDESELAVRHRLSRLTTSLPELGLEVSTGRVVDFRATKFLKHRAGRNAVPLIRPCHFDAGVIRWPAAKERKPCAITDVKQTRQLLIPRGNYVLVKRFTAKEERKRVVASIYDPTLVAASRVGFENHLNYFHNNGKGIGIRLARGLAAFLNSTAVDRYFRHFSGHTQVNAADLRSLRYPSHQKLEELGERLGRNIMEQSVVDQAVEEVL